MAAVNTTKEMTAIDGCLPQELIIDILLRLPAKTLGRFKSVCKTWNGLISTPSFAKSHLDLSSTTTTNANLTSLLFVRARGPAFSFNLGLCDLVGSDIKGNFFPLPSQSQFLHIMGLSHALLCSQCYSFFHVLNPTTKESSDIPLPTLAPRSYPFGFGFGFVPAIDDYKIVLLTSHPQACNCNSYVFSFRDGQWKELDRCTSHLDASMASMHCRRPPPPSYGGVAHAVTWNWAFYRLVPVPQGYCLLKFDVIKEKFSRLLNLGRVASVCVTQDNIMCVCELGNSLVIGKLETEDGDWKPKLRIKPQFPVDSLFGSTSDGYILMRFSDGEKGQLVVVGTNQERPTYHLVKRDCFSYAASHLPSSPLMLDNSYVFGLA